MSLGTGIFSAAVLLSIVILFVVTKDRWKWKRIVIGLFSVAVLLVIGAVVVGKWGEQIFDRPKPFTELGGIKLGASQADVKFLKGLPDAQCTDTEEKDWLLWAYRITADTGTTPTFLVVTFKEGVGVWTVWVRSDNQAFTDAPMLDHINKWSTIEDIDKRFGPPSSVRPSEDQLSRTYAYRKYNLKVDFEKGKLQDYRIYNPKQPEISDFSKTSKRVCKNKDGTDAT
jgi:hypothetical protein